MSYNQGKSLARLQHNNNRATGVSEAGKLHKFHRHTTCFFSSTWLGSLVYGLLASLPHFIITENKTGKLDRHPSGNGRFLWAKTKPFLTASTQN